MNNKKTLLARFDSAINKKLNECSKLELSFQYLITQVGADDARTLVKQSKNSIVTLFEISGLKKQFNSLAVFLNETHKWVELQKIVSTLPIGKVENFETLNRFNSMQLPKFCGQKIKEIKRSNGSVKKTVVPSGRTLFMFGWGAAYLTSTSLRDADLSYLAQLDCAHELVEKLPLLKVLPLTQDEKEFFGV